MSDKSLKILALLKKKKHRKPTIQDGTTTNSVNGEKSSNDLEKTSLSLDNEKNQSINITNEENEDGINIDDDIQEILVQDLENAKAQLAALLSFKEALCSEKCNLAVTNAFREFWVSEQVISTDDTKLGVAICLSYFRWVNRWLNQIRRNCILCDFTDFFVINIYIYLFI